MKIKTQLNMLILAIIILPSLCLLSLPVYHYFTSSQRYLQKGFKEMQKISEIHFTEGQWEMLKSKLDEIPPHVETVLYMNNQILISTMKDLKVGTELTYGELFSFVWSTSEDYSYQIQSPFYTPDNLPQGNPRRQSPILLSRTQVHKDKINTNTLIMPTFFILILFEAFGIMVIMQISKTISSSITLLEKSTLKIANGELDAQIVKPTSRREANEITSLAENLEKMRISLKDDQQRRTKFIMGISHDLRTPVALIKGYAEAITDGVVNEKEQIMKSLSIIHCKADQLEGMINDLINYVKLNNSEWLHTLEPVEINSYIKEFASSAIVTADIYKRNITSQINIDPSIKVPMDKALVGRTLENIFSNAVRYSEDGDTIAIEGSNTENSVKISIKDTGKGISKDDIEHIYDLFYRGTNSRRESGMGIGLSVVRTIIDTHGWKIDVDSELGKGTCFTITIPLKD